MPDIRYVTYHTWIQNSCRYPGCHVTSCFGLCVVLSMSFTYYIPWHIFISKQKAVAASLQFLACESFIVREWQEEKCVCLFIMLPDCSSKSVSNLDNVKQHLVIHDCLWKPPNHSKIKVVLCFSILGLFC